MQKFEHRFEREDGKHFICFLIEYDGMMGNDNTVTDSDIDLDGSVRYVISE